jgi:hexosaminidase
MKKILLLTVLCCRLWPADAQGDCPIIPLPQFARLSDSLFLLSESVPILTPGPGLESVAAYLRDELQRRSGLTLRVKRASVSTGPSIQLVRLPGAGKGRESYRLNITRNGILIEAADNAGIFYGAVSLLQLIEAAGVRDGKAQVPGCRILDSPRYSWRGLMLDESRHFFGKKVVEELLNEMAFYKLNRFHWHLTDEPGWRIEIKKYPRLALVGGKGNYTDSLAAPAYYTQDDIREIVAYAAVRHIVVIPEIDMPGHATAANRAYPEYSGGGSVKHPDFTFNPGKESTYTYLSAILHETASLFPSRMIHIGGDEVAEGNDKWATDPAILNLMQKEKLDSVKAVERYFIRRIADSLISHGERVLGWDEITGTRLAPDRTTVFWWRQDHPETLTGSLEQGYDVVLCPRLPLYLDFVQDSTHRSGRRWKSGGQYNSLKDVYDFHTTVPPAYQQQILGIQANLWTETVVTKQRLDFMIYPRICALAEVAWTEARAFDYGKFRERLGPQLGWLQHQGIYAFDPDHPNQEPLR